MTPGMRLIGYARCSTEEQEDSGLGLEAQEAQMRAACERNGWQLIEIRRAVVSGGVKDPPVLRDIVADVDAGHADGLIVAHLDRLFRSAAGFERLVEWAERRRGGLVILEPFLVDTSDPGGMLLARVIMAVAEFERARIGQRTKRALAAKVARGERVGRPLEASPAAVGFILRRMAEGATRSEVAAELNARGDRRPSGAPWRHVQVGRVLDSVGSASGSATLIPTDA